MKSVNPCIPAMIFVAVVAVAVDVQAAKKKPAAPAGKANAAPAKKLDLENAREMLRVAQNDIVAGNIEAAARKIALVRANPSAVTPRQLNFLSKLMQARAAELADDEAGSRAALEEARKLASWTDEMAACWQVALNSAKASVAAKSATAKGAIDFLASQFSGAARKFPETLAIARLRIDVGDGAGAEKDLTEAAGRIRSAENAEAWAAAAGELAGKIDGGKPSLAGKDLFARLRKAAVGAAEQTYLDAAECRAEIGWQDWAMARDAFARAAVGAKAAHDAAAAALAAGYDLAVAERKGSVPAAKATLAATESLAASVGRSPEVIAARCGGLVKNGMAPQAAEIAWQAAMGAETAAVREKMLMLYGPAAALAGEPNLRKRLNSMKASSRVVLQAAGKLGVMGKTDAALDLLEDVSPEALVEDGRLAAAAAGLLTKLRKQSEKTRGRQAERCHAFADEFAAAAKTVIQEKEKAAAKQEQHAAELNKQSAEFLEMAKQVEK